MTAPTTNTDVNHANWATLIKPTNFDIKPGKDIRKFASFTAEPLERGFGHTLGNALRRVLLSSIQGCAVIGVKIEGITHEFESLDGVKEDVTDIILNLKQLSLRSKITEPKVITINTRGPGPVTASMIDTGHDVDVVDPDQLICTLSTDREIRIELTVMTGKGYVPASQNKLEDAPVGYIAVDATYSPVRRVSYKVVDARVGQRTDYDKLTLDVTTNGVVTPEDAVAYAARILQDQLQTFINFEESPLPASVAGGKKAAKETVDINPHLLMKVDELELSVRSANCLKNDNIVYIGDLVQRSEGDMLRTPNFGRKSLNEIKETLVTMGLGFGMQLDSWPPENIEELAARLRNNEY